MCTKKYTKTLIVSLSILSSIQLIDAVGKSRKRSRQYEKCKTKLKFAERNYMDNQEVRVPVGSDFKINCHVIGSPQPNMTWTKDEAQLKDVSYRSFGGGQDSSLNKLYAINLRNLLVADSGRYKCTADNGQCKTISNTLRLVVTENIPVKIPRIRELYPLVSRVVVGESVSFSCSVAKQRDFTPHIKWIRYRTYNYSDPDVSPLTDAKNTTDESRTTTTTKPPYAEIESRRMSTSRYIKKGVVYETVDLKLETGHRSTLTLRSTTLQDGGEYTCMAFNQIGFDSRRAHLEVRRPRAATLEELERLYMNKYDSSIKLPFSLASLVVIPVCLVVILLIGCAWWHANQQKLEEERNELEKQRRMEMCRVEERIREHAQKMVVQPIPSTSSDSGNGGEMRKTLSLRASYNNAHSGNNKNNIVDNNNINNVNSNNNINSVNSNNNINNVNSNNNINNVNNNNNNNCNNDDDYPNTDCDETIELVSSQ